MDITLWLALTALAVLLGFSAFFSSSETSLFSLDNLQLEQMRRAKNPRIDLIQRMLSEPRRLIVTILIGNETVNVAASVISAALVIRLLGAENKWLNLLIMVPLLLVVGEITPKALAIRNNVAFATFQSRFIELFARAIKPLRWVARQIAEYFTTLVVGQQRSRASIITEDMVRSLAREAVGNGALDKHEAHYIDQIFDFGDMTLREIMTPRSQIFFLPAEMPLDEIADELRRTRHTKVPIFEGDRDSVVGILFARDLLGVDLKRRAPENDRETLYRLLREPYFVSESKMAADLFLTFRRRQLSLALTADEFGGVTGLVTMEDLLECIFGDISSASEQVREGQADFQELRAGQYRVEGSMSIKQFNQLVGAQLSIEAVETVGGLLLQEYGELPKEGARIVVDDYDFTVVSVINRRIGEVVVKAPPRTDDASAEARKAKTADAAGAEEPEPAEPDGPPGQPSTKARPSTKE